MLVNLKVPDETYESYARRNVENPRAEMERSLQAFSELSPKETALFLNSEELKELNTLLGHPISTVKELLDQIKRSQRVSLGDGVEIELNVGQRARLMAQADFFKRDFRDFVRTQVKAGVVNVVGP